MGIFQFSGDDKEKKSKKERNKERKGEREKENQAFRTHK